MAPCHISSPQILAARLKWAQSVGVKLKQARRVVILCLPQFKWSMQLVNSVQLARLSSSQFNRSAQFNSALMVECSIQLVHRPAQ